MYVYLEFPIIQNYPMVSVLYSPYRILENSRGEKGKLKEILRK
jgi:hypothetical protein